MINVIINYINDVAFYSLMSLTLTSTTEEININTAGCNRSEGTRYYTSIYYNDHIEKLRCYSYECEKCKKSTVYEIENENKISNNVLQLIYKNCYEYQAELLNFLCKKTNPNIKFDVIFNEFCVNCNKSHNRKTYLEIKHSGFTKKIPIYSPNDLMILLSFFSIFPFYCECIDTHLFENKLISKNQDKLKNFLGLNTRTNQPPTKNLNYVEYLEYARFMKSMTTLSILEKYTEK